MAQPLHLKKSACGLVWIGKSPAISLVSRNITIIDMSTGCCKPHPVKAEGICGRKVRTDSGDCKDNFNVLFTYPEDVRSASGLPNSATPRLTPPCNCTVPWAVCGALRLARQYPTGKQQPWDAGMKPSGAEEFSWRKFKGALEDADSGKAESVCGRITSGQFLNQAALGAESAMSACWDAQPLIQGRPYLGRAAKVEEVFDQKIEYHQVCISCPRAQSVVSCG